MRKLFILFALIILIFSQKTPAREISFIYINGSDSNSVQNKEWFFNGVEKFHPEMKKAFETDDFTRQRLLNNGQDTIKKEPVHFFWGDMSQEAVQGLINRLNYVKLVSPKAAQFARELFAHWMHDAIWVSKPANMEPIVGKLHEQVMSEYNKGNQIILFGYSAGSFISYNYVLQTSKTIEPYEFLSELVTSEHTKEIMKSTKVTNTCLDALKNSKLGFVTSAGDILLNQDMDLVENIYVDLDKYTKQYCIPDDAVKGVVNFASPFALFYSEMSDLSQVMSEKSELLYIYIVEHGKFLLTVNWANDPLGFPVAKNLTFKDVEKHFNIKMDHELGYVYDKSDVKSRSIFLFAHDSYWRNSKRFARSIVKAYQEGYLNYYKGTNKAN